jgi:protein-disulfide isomerase
VPPTSPGDQASIAQLDERLRKVEAYLAKNTEALAFVQRVLAAEQERVAQLEASEPAPDAVLGVAIGRNLAAGLVDGPPTAPVTIIKVFDFACPYCERMSPILSDVVKEYGGKVRVVFMDRVVHDFATKAHLAACAAAAQGRYLAFKSKLWSQGFAAYSASRGQDRSAYEDDGLTQLARELGLDLARFRADRDGAACSELLAAERTELERFKIDATPTLIVNGALVSGVVEKVALSELIDARLRVAEASGVPAAQYYEREIYGKGERQFRSRRDPKPPPR